MKPVQLSVPGKTFIAGEYLALLGGPSLIFTTEPRFQLLVKKKENSKNPFHPASPAGQLFEREKSFFSQFEMQFQDPYLGQGGMGASSGAYALMHSLLQWKDHLDVEAERSIDLQWLLSDYKIVSHIEGNYPPSGADVVAQVFGGFSYFDRNNGKVQVFSWPFENIRLSLWATGNKLPTHEHLKALKNFSHQVFEQSMSQLQNALAQVDEGLFVEGLRSYFSELKKQNLVATETLKFLELISQLKGVCAAKGCGALGADVIAVVYDKTKADKAELETALKKMGLKFRGDETFISHAVKASTCS